MPWSGHGHRPKKAPRWQDTRRLSMTPLQHGRRRVGYGRRRCNGAHLGGATGKIRPCCAGHQGLGGVQASTPINSASSRSEDGLHASGGLKQGNRKRKQNEAKGECNTTPFQSQGTQVGQRQRGQKNSPLWDTVTGKPASELLEAYRHGSWVVFRPDGQRRRPAIRRNDGSSGTARPAGRWHR